VQVLPQVAQQLETPGVGPGLDPVRDVGPGRGLGLEVPPDHRGELLERLEHREIQVTEEIGREYQTAMTVDHERFHDVTSWAELRPPVSLPYPVIRRGPRCDLGHTCRTRNPRVMPVMRSV